MLTIRTRRRRKQRHIGSQTAEQMEQRKVLSAVGMAAAVESGIHTDQPSAAVEDGQDFVCVVSEQDDAGNDLHSNRVNVVQSHSSDVSTASIDAHFANAVSNDTEVIQNHPSSFSFGIEREVIKDLALPQSFTADSFSFRVENHPSSFSFGVEREVIKDRAPNSWSWGAIEI